MAYSLSGSIPFQPKNVIYTALKASHDRFTYSTMTNVPQRKTGREIQSKLTLSRLPTNYRTSCKAQHMPLKWYKSQYYPKQNQLI